MCVCTNCKRVCEAENDLPKSGSYGKNIIALVTEYRATRIPYDQIPQLVKTACGLVVAKSTVINMIANVSDQMEKDAKTITNTVVQSPFVNIDETSYTRDGQLVWAWCITYKKNIAIIMNKSRGAYVMDAYMDKFYGVAVTDGYPVYKRFDPGGMHQRCWAHELRAAKHMSMRHGGAYRKLYEEMCMLFENTKNYANCGARVRHAFEYAFDCMLDRYHSFEMPEMKRLIKRLVNATETLFAFIEHKDIPPTNNAAERALRDVVVRRKISGQIRGLESMKRMSNFLTCVLTWKAHGKNVFEEVLRIV
ncbi:MAG: Transposase [Cenarchaeum symbiont of Oopsacas minuta]|nr:Transposase [Cenarchaeum symbiont of Oopsacas minuta]